MALDEDTPDERDDDSTASAVSDTSRERVSQ